MPSGEHLTPEKARELQKKGVIVRRRNARGQQPTIKRKAEAIELHKSGLEVNQIAVEMGVSRRTVNRYLKETTA